MITLLLGNFSRADIYVVTHRDNPVQTVALNDIRDLYLGRRQSLPSGEAATVYDRADTELRTRFIQTALGMRVRQFDAYWARLIFAGRVLPLSLAEQEKELQDYLSNNIHAIGYTEKPPQSQSLKTLLVINDSK